MNVFNSLGSNYNILTSVKTLFAISNYHKRLQLISLLEEKFNGKALLFYKGRHALEVALSLSGLPSGSLVAINGYTCSVVERAIKKAGFTPIFLDIDSTTLNFTLKTLKKTLNGNRLIKAVVAQHTMGIKADIKNIADFCSKNNLILIEDLAHTIEEGKYGDFVTLSFSQDKIIDCVSGGALVIRNKRYRNISQIKLSKVSVFLQIKDRFYPILTYLVRKLYPFYLGKIFHLILKELKILSIPVDQKYSKDIIKSLPDWHIFVCLEYFKCLDKDISHRKNVVNAYKKHLNKNIQFIGNPLIRFPIKVNNRYKLIKYLSDKGVYVSDIWFDAPVSPKKWLRRSDYKMGQCPVAENVSELMVNLPTHRNINIKKAKVLSGFINKWLILQQEK